MRLVLIVAVLTCGIVFVAWSGWVGPPSAPDRVREQRRAMDAWRLSMISTAVGSLLAGARRRASLRRGRGYSSPLVAWLTKRIALAASCGLAVYGTAPVPVGIAWILLVCAAGSMAAAAYVANLPLRL